MYIYIYIYIYIHSHRYRYTNNSIKYDRMYCVITQGLKKRKTKISFIENRKHVRYIMFHCLRRLDHIHY